MTLFLLLMGHAVADFGLQSEWMAKNKRASVIVLLNHALINAAAVYLVAGGGFAVAELVLHLGIDRWTSRSRQELWFDQCLHLACKIGYVMAGASATLRP